MAESTDLYSRTPTFHDTDAGYILPNEYATFLTCWMISPVCSRATSRLQLMIPFTISPAEHSRLHHQHLALVALTDNRVVHAPISDPHTVLDIGCGTGIITRYLGNTQFPNASHIYGIDLSPIPAPQPGETQAANVTFLRGDFLKLSGTHPCLQFGSADFVFSRMLQCGMTDWLGYMNAVFKTLKPGGWLEMADYSEDFLFTDNRPTDPHKDWEWLRAIRAGGKRQSLDLDVARNHATYMENAGFVDVKSTVYKFPYWEGAEKEFPGSELITRHAVGDRWGFYWHLIPRLVAGSEYQDEEEVERLRGQMRWDLRGEEGKFQTYYVTVGRKPVVGSQDGG